MKSTVGLLLCIAVLLADNANIFDYQNYQGHTDFTDYYGEHHSGEQFNRTKYVLEKLAKENKLDLIKEEFKKLKQFYGETVQGEGGYVSNDTIIDRAATSLLEQLPENAEDIAKKTAGAKRDTKALQTEVSKVNQYLKKYKLFNIIKINKEDYKIKIDLKRKITKSEENALIRVQQELANCKHDDSYGRFGESLMEHIEGYLVQYAIKNKDESLMKSILFKDVLHGNGCNASYTETIPQNQYIPFYLHYQNIDKYLDQKEIDKATNRILDVMGLYNETAGNQGLWAKYNSTFIFPDEGKEKEFKFKDFIKMVDKQSPRLANDVTLSHIFSVLSINGLMNEDDSNATIEK